jgi:hypothetical protein
MRWRPAHVSPHADAALGDFPLATDVALGSVAGPQPPDERRASRRCIIRLGAMLELMPVTQWGRYLGTSALITL